MDDNRFDRLDSKLDRIVDHIQSIDITLAKQSVSLDEHIKRSNMLEAKLVPVERHVAMVHGALKLIGLIAILVGIAEGVVKIKGG